MITRSLKITRILRGVLLGLLLIMGGLCYGQDFQLFFANNVTDVTNFYEIESVLSGLEWREVKKNEAVVYGNQVEVEQVKKMFASTEMKHLEQQRQFWRMRDHNLLCFRINDGGGTTGTYEVEVDDHYGTHLTTMVTRYFYVNVRRQIEPVTVKVWKADDPLKVMSVDYYVYDWDDDNLYTFQLDSKRQVTGETYSLEYMVGKTDENGDYVTRTQVLDLKQKAFQSFYVAEDEDLLDVLLKSGEHRLRLKKSALHPGVTLDPDFEVISLSPTFYLDKHENRELVNFNWIGSGLYEKYDTLYVSLFNERGKNISLVDGINVEQVDANGNCIKGSGMRYLGYDKKRKVHMVLTYGNRALLEILAPGYSPTIYKYAGAADAETGIVDLELCTANVTMHEDENADDGISLSSQHLQIMRNTHTVVKVDKTDYSLCDIEDMDLSQRLPAETVCYTEDAGNSWPKILNREFTSRYAMLELAFSSPSTSSMKRVTLKAIDTESKEVHSTTWQDMEAVYASDFPSFTRDYFFCHYNLLNFIPVNSTCQLSLSTGSFTYENFPILNNVYVDREDLTKKAEETANKNFMKDPSEDGFSTLGDTCQFSFPVNINLKLPAMKIKNSLSINLTKQVIDLTTTLSFLSPSDGKDEDPYKEMRDDMKNANDGTFSPLDPENDKAGKVNFSNDQLKFKDWVLNEAEDIFSYNAGNIGVGFYGSAKFAFSLAMNQTKWKNPFTIKTASMTLGYGATFATPDLLGNLIAGDSPLASVLDKVPAFKVGAGFEASVQLEGGMKTLNPKYEMTTDNFGWFATFSAKLKMGAWAQIGTPPNPFANLNFGFRAGGKLGFNFGIAGKDLIGESAPDWGMYFVALAAIEAYANVKTVFFNWSGRAGLHFGKQFYKPDNGHNPLHKDYPYWLTGKAKPMHESYRHLAPVEPTNMGSTLVADVGSDANPHFLDADRVLYNDMGTPESYNDDRVTLLNTETNTKETLSVEGMPATRSMRSKHGEYDIVVFEQTARPVATEEVTEEHAATTATELAARTMLISKTRTGTSDWVQTNITTDDGVVDTKPVVTIQDDGKAACVWQRGSFRTIDDTMSTDSLYNNAFYGDLVLSTYSDGKWSEPVKLFGLAKDVVADEYDLVMRNDTVLVGTNLVYNPLDTALYKRTFYYSSYHVGDRFSKTVREELQPIHFFMNRVGQHAVIAMLYEKSDSTRDVFVKTLAMSGRANGIAGSDIGANFCSPNRVKIVCDRAATSLNDFAVLWTEMNNTVRNDDGTQTQTDDTRIMLNASRISLQPSPRVTLPITVGADLDSLSLIDFDGVLDDAQLKVVYSLADIESGSGLIMQNEIYFRNSFDFNIAYTRQALQGSSTLPVNVTVRNTGTSPIKHVTATINDQDFDIDDSYVAPLRQQTFVVQYPINEDFDGYLSSHVTVEYENMFRAKNHPKMRAMSFLKQTKEQATSHVDAENIECRLIGHSVEDGANTFVVELIDHSLHGLKNRNGIHVGIYPHPTFFIPVCDEAEITVTAEDFNDYGGVRKAYATVTVPGVKETTSAYLTTHLYDMWSNADETESYVSNMKGFHNDHYVTLLPAADVNSVKQIMADENKNGSKVHVEHADGGVRVSGLETGTLRIFSAGGYLVYKRDIANEQEVFIPLKNHDVYLLSSGKEIHKFSY